MEDTFPEIQLNALDLSEEMISETRERLSDTAIVTVGDAEHMPFESEQFQVVTCNMSIHHYPHAYTLTDERRIPVILDTDDRDKAARYEHLGMKLDRVHSCGERFHMYDLSSLTTEH